MKINLTIDYCYNGQHESNQDGCFLDGGVERLIMKKVSRIGQKIRWPLVYSFFAYPSISFWKFLSEIWWTFFLICQNSRNCSQIISSQRLTVFVGGRGRRGLGPVQYIFCLGTNFLLRFGGLTPLCPFSLYTHMIVKIRYSCRVFFLITISEISQCLINITVSRYFVRLSCLINFKSRFTVCKFTVYFMFT